MSGRNSTAELIHQNPNVFRVVYRDRDQGAIKSGDIREDLDAIDLLRALVGVANIATTPDWKKSARKLVDILILGSRPVK